MSTYFQASKERYEAAFTEWVKAYPSILSVKKLSEITDCEKLAYGDLVVGDTVEVINGFGHKLKGFKILAIEENEKDIAVYLDWDCYWFPKNIKDIVRKVEPTENMWFDEVEQILD